MDEVRAFVCIVCPRGCGLTVRKGAGGIEVAGNACRRGADYGRAEVLDPRRSLSTTVRLEGMALRRLPVRSSAPLPLGRLMEAARALDAVVVDRPLRCGDVVVRDHLGLGVDIVATDSVLP
jgi:CxxC motif-containing protein